MRLKAILSLAIALISFAKVQGAVILTVDISNPEAVVFTSTGAFAQNTEPLGGESYASEGFMLLDFFTTDAGDVEEWFSSSTLLPPGPISFAYTMLYGVSRNPFEGAYVDLNIFASELDVAQNFSIAAPAFTGSAVADLSNWVSIINVGATGDIITGDPSYSMHYTPVVIGQYEVIGGAPVIPEPATGLLLLGAGLAGLAFWRQKTRPSV